jgi:hypothetical protein
VTCALVALVFTAVGAYAAVGSGAAVGSSPLRPTPGVVVASGVLGGVVIALLWTIRGSRRPIADHAAGLPVAPMVVLPTACLALAVVSPHYFDSIAREDGVIEWLGAIATACACLWLLMGSRRVDRGTAGLLVVAACVLFVLTGEELSWLQRVGQFGTPDVLASNQQGEANLHNLATDRVQALYYLATSAALVVLPYLARWTRWVPVQLRLLVPGPSVVILAATSTAFSYGRTGNVVHHLTLWTAVGVLLWWSRQVRPAWLMGLVVVMVGQAVMWNVGPELLRPWAPDEYREMLLGVAFAAWAWEVRERSARVVNADDGASLADLAAPPKRTTSTRRPEPG